MWKIIDKKEKSLIKFLLTSIVFIIWIIVLLFVIPTVLTLDETFMQYYIPFAVVVCWLIICFLLLWLDYNLKPRFKDWKYVWKDWRIYEWDWDKRYWANWKWKLTWVDWSYYEWRFNNGHLYWKWKKVCPSGEIYEWDWKNDKWNWKWKLTWSDWSYYEWDFKKGKPDWMWVIKMKNWYYYEWEFNDWKRTWRFKKQVLTTWWLIEWEFRDNWNKSFDWVWKVITSDWFVFEWIFQNWKLNWEWKMIIPERAVLLWTFENWDLKTWKQILKNWEYSEWNRDNWYLTWVARYYFKDGSYYEWEYKRWWKWTWTYIAKNWDKYQTEFPYEIINFFMNWLNSKMKEIQWNLNYIPKSEKEKIEERDRYLEISEKWTSIQKEIAEIFLDLWVEGDKFLELIKKDRGINNYISAYSNINDYYINVKNECKNLLGKHHIKSSSKWLYSYGEFFSKLDLSLDWEIKLGDLLVKVFKFLDPEYVLDFIVKKDKKDKEWIRLIDDFSQVYGKDIQLELDWREYEKNFWKYNFKPDKKSK